MVCILLFNLLKHRISQKRSDRLVVLTIILQFPDIVECCEELANLGKTVIVAALDGTFQRVGFGNILNLIPLAESVVKLSAVCMLCFGNASFTKRTSNETKVK